MPAITVFLTSADRIRIYTPVKSEADAIQRIRGAKVVTFNLPTPTGDLGDTLEQVWEVTNAAPGLTAAQQEAEWEYRFDGETRSMSVGDVVHVEGLGIFSADRIGWKRHDHRLTANAAAHALRRALGQEASA